MRSGSGGQTSEKGPQPQREFKPNLPGVPAAQRDPCRPIEPPKSGIPDLFWDETSGNFQAYWPKARLTSGRWHSQDLKCVL